MRFVKIKGTIYDYTRYRLSITNLEKSVNDEIGVSLLKFGFVKHKENIFYNRKYDLLLRFSIRKKSKLKFI